MTRKPLAVASLLIALLVLAANAWAADPTPPLADKLPGQSLLYVGWGGAAANKEAMAKTGLARLLDDPEVKPYIEPIAAQLEAFIKKQAEGKLPPGVYDPIRSLLVDVVWDRPWAISLIDVKLPGAEQPAPAVEAVLLVDAGDKADAALANMTALLTKFMPPDMQQSIKDETIKAAKLKSLTVAPDAPAVLWGVYKKILVVAVSSSGKAMGPGNMPEKLVALIDGGGAEGEKTLAADPQFAKVAAKVGSGLYNVYADLARFRKDLLPAILAMTGQRPDKVTEINKVIGALGLDAIDAIAIGCRAEGGEVVSNSYILAPTGKPGLLVLADQKPLEDGLLAAVPADATFAVVGNFNRPKMIDELEKQLAKFPEADAEFNKARKSIEDAAGIDLRKDLAEAVGDGVAIYNSPSAGGFLFTTLTVVAEVKDAAKLKAALPKVEAALLKWVKDNGGRDVAPLGFQAGKFKNYDYRYLVAPGLPVPVAPAWCLTDKYMVVSLFPQSLKEALLQIEAGKAGSLLSNDWLAGQIAGAKGASLVSYTNQRQLLRIVYPIVLPVWQVACNMAGSVGIKLDVNSLPRQALLMKYLGDSFGAMVPDKDGVLFTERSPSLMPGFGGAVATEAMAISILLPALGQSRDAARRAKSLATLKGWGMTFRIYASAHNDEYPDSLAVPVKEKLTSPEELVSPMQKGPGESYIYIKPPAQEPANSAQWVVMYERPENYNNTGTNVLFADAHVAWVTMDRFKELLAKTKAEAAEAAKAAPPAGKTAKPAPTDF